MSVYVKNTLEGGLKIEIDDELPEPEGSVEEFHLTTLDALKLVEQINTELGGHAHPSTIMSLNIAWEYIKHAEDDNRQLRMGLHTLKNKNIQWPAGTAALVVNHLLARQHAKKWSYHLGCLQIRGYDVEHQRKRLEFARTAINGFFEECEIQIQLKDFADIEN